MADGWPLGLKLVLAVMTADRDPRAAAETLLRQKGALHDRFVALLVANLDPSDVAFLTSVSILDDFNPALGAAVSGSPDAAERLRQIAATTPVLVTGEQSDWMRLHALAREALRKRFGKLADEERSVVHARAAQWSSANGLVAGAAQHALAAGRRDWAYELAERSLYNSLMVRGRLDDIQEWFSIIPGAESDARLRLLLAAAWSFAIGERHTEAERLVARVLARDDIDDELRCECALIRAGAAVFADDPDRFAALHDPWAVDPPLNDPWLLKSTPTGPRSVRCWTGSRPWRACVSSAHRAAIPTSLLGTSTGGATASSASATCGKGRSCWQSASCGPALLQADADLGRRNPFSCMLAALLAAAMWERDQPRDAELALANRLDVLERSGLPDAVLARLSNACSNCIGGGKRSPGVGAARGARCRRSAPSTAAASGREPGGTGDAAFPALSG